MTAIAVFGAAGCSSGSSSSEGDLKGIVRPVPLEVGQVVLPDVTGQPDDAPGTPFTFAAQPGQLLVVYFGYTNCPDLCPATLANVETATNAMGPEGDDIDLAMVTVDPSRDTPEQLTRYLRSFRDRVHAIRTTDATQLQAAEDQFGAQSAVTTATDGTVDVEHTAFTYVIDQNGQVLVEWPFGVNADNMQHDLTELLGRARSGA